MIRYIFAALMILHGLIHLMGFTKAFKYNETSGITGNISKPAGLLWLLSCFLFITSAFVFLLDKGSWWILAAMALLLSQILVVIYWHDAKAGTVANIIIFLVALVSWAKWDFNKKVQQEIRQVMQQEDRALRQIDHFKKNIVTEDMIKNLPTPVQRWLRNSGIMGREMIHSVHLKQKGWMRMAPDKKNWIEATSEQYFTTDKPAFIWHVKMQMMPLVSVSGRDKFVDGKGQMLIKAFSLVNIVNDEDEKIDQGTLQRYLAEICWFPSAALSPYIIWQPIDDSTATAIMTYHGTKGSVTFYFNKLGDMVSCKADRFKGSGPGATLEKWVVNSTGFAVMNGIRMPVKSEATWQLAEGDFTWYKLEITDIEYNIIENKQKIRHN
ncbi:hypothetical protein OCK74_07415 [Chitinophagaceae bacterium LB-8]|uniref:Uncharacterized protein n=1 Tax=Paraflavisolibacter caeni TaxID=2982496 RepID=A0A9X2XNR7_9BACT|nr:DUF6544 family protein [Paraflavisolibacter caeni]MCU7548939.1 hypothetical protein [Paraflavisolibacter caeni]